MSHKSKPKYGEGRTFNIYYTKIVNFNELCKFC